MEHGYRNLTAAQNPLCCPLRVCGTYLTALTTSKHHATAFAFAIDTGCPPPELFVTVSITSGIRLAP
jgi:hypothetical protein